MDDLTPSPRLGVNGRLVPVDGVAGQDSVGLAVQHGEPAGAVEAPPVGDASDGPSGRVGGQEILAGSASVVSNTSPMTGLSDVRT